MRDRIRLRFIYLTGLLFPLLMLIGCGDGLSGQATGQNAAELEDLELNLSYVAEAIADFTNHHRDFETMATDSLSRAEYLTYEIEELSGMAALGSAASSRLSEESINVNGTKTRLESLVVGRDASMGGALCLIKYYIEDMYLRIGDQQNLDLNPCENFEDFTIVEQDFAEQDIRLRAEGAELLRIEEALSRLRAEILVDNTVPDDVPEDIALPRVNPVAIPHVFVGIVASSDGYPVQAGHHIEAFIPGYEEPVGSASVSTESEYTMAIEQYGTALESGVTTVTFFIDGETTNQTAIWEDGGGTVLDLTFDAIRRLCDVTSASQLSAKGFVFQNENEIFLKVDNYETPLGYTNGVVGDYIRINPTNEWHYGSISTSGDNYRWTNTAGVSWPLYEGFMNGRFETDASNPYYDFPAGSPSRYFTLMLENPACESSPPRSETDVACDASQITNVSVSPSSGFPGSFQLSWNYPDACISESQARDYWEQRTNYLPLGDGWHRGGGYGYSMGTNLWGYDHPNYWLVNEGGTDEERSCHAIDITIRINEAYRVGSGLSNYNSGPHSGILSSTPVSVGCQDSTESTPAADGTTTKIAFASQGIHVMNDDGSNLTRLTDTEAYRPSWSPDGTKIAFSSFQDGNFEIYVMNSDGSNQSRLTNDPSWDMAPSWSPDGTKIAFVTTRNGNDQVYVMNVDGSNVIRLTDNSNKDYRPSWSPDGTKIAFHSDRDGNDEIYVMNIDGSSQTRLTNDPGQDLNVSWSPDGTKIAFHSDRDGPGDMGGGRHQYEIYIMNADGSDQVRLTDDIAKDIAPSWSPDGSKIAFSSDRDGTDDIYVMHADGSNQIRLTSLMGSEIEPSWKPVSVINPIMYLDVYSDERYQEWITGYYYPCQSVPCGHLDVTTWNDEDIYVKVSGQSTDPQDEWYWAYIYKYSPNTWVIQYVSPALTDENGNYLWNAHRYIDGQEPWSETWPDIDVTPIFGEDPVD